MHGTRLPSSTNPNPRSISIRIARDPNDLMLITAIRAAVYLAEQDCPIEEEFDGNDLVAAHFIGFVGTEPAGCLRVRFLANSPKWNASPSGISSGARACHSSWCRRASTTSSARGSGKSTVRRRTGWWISGHISAPSLSVIIARSLFPISPIPKWSSTSSRAPMPSRSTAIPT
jgi:hypothetical protein